VRRDATAPSALSGKRNDAGSRLRVGLLLIGLIACLLALHSVPASAATASDRPLLFSFDGSDTTAGAFAGLNALEIDQAGDAVYVIDTGNNVLDKFSLAGEAEDFSATSSSSLNPGFSFNSFSDVAVDNSAANPGQIDVMPEFGPVKAFSPAGSELWELGGFGDACGLAIDAEGHSWVGEFNSESLREFASSGAPPTEIGSIATNNFPCRLDLDASGNQYVNNYQGSVDKYVGGANVATIDPGPNAAVTVDKSSPAGHVFTLHADSFNEYDAAGNLLGNMGGGDFAGGQGIAYDQSLDRVYVADSASNTVKVFGAAVTGTVPDPTISPATDVGVTTALLHGTVNPQGVANDWHFEWKTDSQTWAEAESSPAASLPVDSADHPVSYEATGLAANSTYEFRLVTVNTTLNLKAISAVESFNNIRSEAVTLGVAPRTDTAARLKASIVPAGSDTTYHFEYSADGVNWTGLPDHTIAADSAATIVSEELSGLQPGATYRYRVIVANTAGAASPQGSEVTFTTRTSAEVTEPSSCPNEDVRATQHSEYLGDCRAVELVNNPQKGNQNPAADVPALHTPPMTADGNQVLWSLFGGAPGGTTGAAATFLSQRTPQGWQSQSLIPPAAGQVGGGEYKYTLESATPDFSQFVFMAGKSSLGGVDTPTLLRLDRNQQQDELSSYPNVFYGYRDGAGGDLSDDGSLVFFTNPETHQLEAFEGGSSEVVSVMPDGTPSECGLSRNGASFTGGRSGDERAGEMSWRPGYHSFNTTDGLLVYFEAEPNGGCGNPYGLYVRNRETDETTLIDPGAEGHDVFKVRATPDGSAMYFVTFSQLDPDDGNTNADVYRWDERTEASTCLTCVVPDAEVRVIGNASTPVLVSDDFSHVYFQSTKRLIPGQGTSGDTNFYVLSNGELRFVADAGPFENLRRTLISADGNVLLLQLLPRPQLTPDDVPSECLTVREPIEVEKCVQLYRYDDRDRSLECISCRREGTTTYAVSAPAYGDTQSGMSSDGEVAAFVTATPLVSTDVNSWYDIYEWRDGSPHLLTDGVSTFPASPTSGPQVRALSADGSDILYALVDPGRTGFERDGVANLYDARVDGGFVPPPPTPRCSEESCQGPLQALPGLESPASAAVRGIGNEKPQARKPKPRCGGKRAKAKRRCASKKKHKQTKHKAGGSK
jgi:hypothetical protein